MPSGGRNVSYTSYPISLSFNSNSAKRNTAYNNAKHHHNNEKGSHNHNISRQEDNMNHKTEKKDDIIFEVFGIKLHYDDILLIFLIFFLYNEGVKDEFLFIALVLLLLS